MEYNGKPFLNVLLKGWEVIVVCKSVYSLSLTWVWTVQMHIYVDFLINKEQYYKVFSLPYYFLNIVFFLAYFIVGI